jgi:hypothetical protein
MDQRLNYIPSAPHFRSQGNPSGSHNYEEVNHTPTVRETTRQIQNQPDMRFLTFVLRLIANMAIDFWLED